MLSCYKRVFFYFGKFFSSLSESSGNLSDLSQPCIHLSALGGSGKLALVAEQGSTVSQSRRGIPTEGSI